MYKIMKCDGCDPVGSWLSEEMRSFIDFQDEPFGVILFTLCEPQTSIAHWSTNRTFYRPSPH